jgi:hypothetical protein
LAPSNHHHNCGALPVRVCTSAWRAHGAGTGQPTGRAMMSQQTLWALGCHRRYATHQHWSPAHRGGGPRVNKAALPHICTGARLVGGLGLGVSHGCRSTWLFWSLPQQGGGSLGNPQVGPHGASWWSRHLGVDLAF